MPRTTFNSLHTTLPIVQSSPTPAPMSSPQSGSQSQSDMTTDYCVLAKQLMRLSSPISWAKSSFVNLTDGSDPQKLHMFLLQASWTSATRKTFSETIPQRSTTSFHSPKTLHMSSEPTAMAHHLGTHLLTCSWPYDASHCTFDWNSYRISSPEPQDLFPVELVTLLFEALFSFLIPNSQHTLRR